MRGLRWVSTALLLVAALAAPAAAQVPGPQLSGGGFDIGLGVRFIHRDVRAGEVTSGTSDFHLTGGFARYGVHDRLTLSGEVAAANTHALEQALNERNLDARYLLLGIGAQALLVDRGRWRIASGLHVSRALLVSREAGRCNERDTEWLASVHVERNLVSGRHDLVVFGGPAYGEFHLDTPGANCIDETRRSDDNWGLFAGVDALWSDRVRTFVHAVYIEYVQPRVGVAFHFGP